MAPRDSGPGKSGKKNFTSSPFLIPSLMDNAHAETTRWETSQTNPVRVETTPVT